MGKGYKRKTRWRILNIGAPPGEEDEEDGIRNGYTKGQENGTNSRNGQTGRKTGRTDSAGSTTSDYASDYASAVSRSRRDDSGGAPTKPKFTFNENEYTRITTPRQDVLFKKGYLSRRHVQASTASTSATPSTTESQSASHSTADGSETIEDQQLLDCKENGAVDYTAVMKPGAQVAYGSFFDQASGYYYEYPVMVVGPGPIVPGVPPMHNILTAVPCGPVPLRPIEWVNPAFVPKLGSEQYCVMDYQTAQLGQYPTLVDENGVPLTAQTENTDGSEEVYHENGDQSASLTSSIVDEEQSSNNAETQNGTTETSSTNETEEVAQSSVNSDLHLETALAEQLHVTHVTPSSIPEPYVYPRHYMFGPSLINVDGVTIQSVPMVWNTGVAGSPTGACAKRRKRKKFSRKKSRRPLDPGKAEDEEQDEEDYSSEAASIAGVQPGVVNEAVATEISKVDSLPAGIVTSRTRPLNPECQEFRPAVESRIIIANNDATFGCESTVTDETSSGPSSSVETTDKEPRIAERPETEKESSETVCPISADNDNDVEENGNATLIPEKSVPQTSKVEKTEKLVSTKNEEMEAAPVDFAAEVFANVSVMAQRALASRSVVEGTPMVTEIGLEATSVNFQEILENVQNRSGEIEHEDVVRNGRSHGASAENEIVSNGLEDRGDNSIKRTPSSSDESSAILDVTSDNIIEKHRRDSSGLNDKRGSRSASPGMINRTTTPINANSQRLPESYESLVIRSAGTVSCSMPSLGSTIVQQQQSRNRKYISKTPKFVREATPGPDLDEVQTHSGCGKVDETRTRDDKPNSVNIPVTTTTRTYRNSLEDRKNDDETIETGVEAPEIEMQRYSLSTTEGSSSYAWEKRGNNADLSNDDSGIETQTRFSSDHPITDAVTEWLQRANSPELFVTAVTMSDNEPEDDELENDEPPKNLQGNPMPALSANSSSVNDDESSRLASFGKFASFNDATEESTNEIESKCKTNENIETMNNKKDESSLVSRRKRRGDCKKRTTTKKNALAEASKIMSDAQTEVDVNVKNSVGAARHRLSEKKSSIEKSEIEKNVESREACELIENDSVAGMRVAKSSRKKKLASVTSTTNIDSWKNRGVVDKTTRLRRNDKTGNKVTVASNREVPIENVKITVRRMTGEENDEGIVEDEEVSVRTFEKGEIIVSNEGKVLPVDDYQPVLLKNKQPGARMDQVEYDERPRFNKITCEKSQRDDTSVSDDTSKRNSLGSIEEPDVLECWEIETVEPIATPKKIQARGRSLEGEDNEDDNVDGTTTDPAGIEIVRKYYRLEAMRDSGTSVTSVDDDCRDNENNTDVSKVSIVKSPDDMIESICSDDIPVIGERMNKIVEIMLERSGIPVEEAVEVYESCYGGEKPPYLVDFNTKYQSRNLLFGQDPEREGAVPCKAACCNLQ